MTQQLENDVITLYYVITFPERRFDFEAKYMTDVKCISRSKEIAESEYKNHDPCGATLLEINSADVKDTMWIVFSYNVEDPSWCYSIKFIGGTREECLTWWKENWIDYIDYNDYDPEEDDVPEFENGFDNTMSGLIMKEMKIS